MKRYAVVFALFLVATLLLPACSMLTVDEMYCIPKRSEDYNNLQSAIDQAMSGMSYCAPLTGEHQQPVQMADLDGDGEEEYLLFAKTGESRPLRILVFKNQGGSYVHSDTVECSGSAFDIVEYIQMDGRPGLEMVVGCLVSDQVVRSMTMYSMYGQELTQLVTENYTKFLPVDLDGNGVSEVLVIHPGDTDTDNGNVALYAISKDGLTRSNEVDMSRPADKLKRIITGKLQDGSSAVYLASTVDDSALITDVVTVRENMLANVSISSELGTSVQTMRNYYVYADDIDKDGIVELPALMTMKPQGIVASGDKYHLIRWYAMSPDGTCVDKMYTFHNFLGGWYVQLDSKLAPRLTVSVNGSQYDFYLWDAEYKATQKLISIYAFSAQNKEEQATADGRFVLYRTETTVYAAELDPAAAEYGFTQDSITSSFRIIRQDWKTGET